MPWWGWLIGFGITCVCVTAVIVATVTAWAMRDVGQETDPGYERWRQQRRS